MKKLYILLIDTYLIVASLASALIFENIFGPTLAMLFGVAAIVMIIINIISAARIRKRMAENEALQQKVIRGIFWYKILLIPVYATFFMLASMMLTFAIFLPLLFLWIFALIILAYLLLVTSALYAVAIIRTKHKEGILKIPSVIHGILQFLFVLDVIDYIVLFIRLRKPKVKKKLTQESALK
jgi:hypothetical protein